MKLGLKYDENILNSENKQSQDIDKLFETFQDGLKLIVEEFCENQINLKSKLH